MRGLDIVLWDMAFFICGYLVCLSTRPKRRVITGLFNLQREAEK